jgi:hypothetical protein
LNRHHVAGKFLFACQDKFKESPRFAILLPDTLVSYYFFPPSLSSFLRYDSIVMCAPTTLPTKVVPTPFDSRPSCFTNPVRLQSIPFLKSWLATIMLPGPAEFQFEQASRSWQVPVCVSRQIQRKNLVSHHSTRHIGLQSLSSSLILESIATCAPKNCTRQRGTWSFRLPAFLPTHRSPITFFLPSFATTDRNVSTKK